MSTDTIKVPLSQRINLRMILFFAVIALLIGYPVYIYVDSAVSGGIKSYGNYSEVDLKSMGNFPFDGTNGTINDVPAKWRELDGKRILLQGEVWDPNEAGQYMTNFQLVYSIQKCCFGGPPKVQERVFVHIPQGMQVDNLSGSFAKITGTLHIKAEKDAGNVASLYTLVADKVEPM
jgi:hypothetical protein